MHNMNYIFVYALGEFLTADIDHKVFNKIKNNSHFHLPVIDPIIFATQQQMKIDCEIIIYSYLFINLGDTLIQNKIHINVMYIYRYRMHRYCYDE